MMLPTFERWLGELCLFYTRPNWPTEENVAAAFRDVKHMDGQALEFIGSFIRTRCEEWPKSLSAVMVKGYDAWRLHKAEEAKANAREESCPNPTVDQLEANRQRAEKWLPKILRVSSLAKAPYLGEEGFRTRRAG